MPYEYLPFGAVRPRGWLQQAMGADLRYGYIGFLDELAPHLIRDCDIFGEDRRARASGRPELGILGMPAAGDVSAYQWWNGETQGNWLDGLIRTAGLLDDRRFIDKAKAYFRRATNAAGEDGYLGVYAPDLRFLKGRENGELWTLGALLRGLLALYELEGDPQTLDYAVRAADCAMAAYPLDASSPFDTSHEKPNSVASGLSHGLMFTDALMIMHRLTGEPRYLAYAAFLYDDYARHEGLEPDCQLPRLLDPAQPFRGHGVHTYEHLRALVYALEATGRDDLRRALAGYITKLEACLLPSGAPIGDEYICGLSADADVTGYEYCCLQELLHSYAALYRHTDDPQWAERMEWLFFNAALGARQQNLGGIAYLAADNAYAMRGAFHTPQPHVPLHNQTRYKYSPTHSDVACCCVPNAGRVFPTYVCSMWAREGDMLTKALYGSSALRTQVQGVEVAIEEMSAYPAFTERIAFIVRPAAPVAFGLRLRVPRWCGRAEVSGLPGALPERQGAYIVIRRAWEGETRFELCLQREPRMERDVKGDGYVAYGPLLMALPIEDVRTPVREYDLPFFRDYHAVPARGERWDYEMPAAGHNLRPWDDPGSKGFAVQVLATLRNRATGELEDRKFVPFADTLLRRATFPIHSEETIST